MAKRKKEKGTFRYVSRRRRNIARFIVVAIAIGLISMFLAALWPWPSVYSRWGSTANRESGWLETSPDYDYSEERWSIEEPYDYSEEGWSIEEPYDYSSENCELYDYRSEYYMLDDMPDLGLRHREYRYFTFTLEDGETVTFRLSFPCF